MAYLTINSKFKPYSFQERIAPYQQYIEDYKLNQAAASELETKASIWNNMLQEQDTLAIQQRDQYLEDIKQASEAMASEGLTASNRAAILNLKPRYASEIVPIEQAYNTRKALQDEARKLKAQGITLERDLNTASLNNWMQNPNYDYGRSFNKKELVAQAARDFSALSKAANKGPAKFNEILNGQYYQATTNTGFTVEEIQQGLRDKNPNVINAVVTNLIKSSGVDNWEDTKINQQIKNDLRAALENEAYNALGKTTTKELNNKNFLTPLQKKALKDMDKKPPTLPPLNAINLFSRSDMKKREDFLATFKEKGYIEDSGEGYKLTEAGKEQYKNSKSNNKTLFYPATLIGSSEVGSSFKKTLDALKLEYNTADEDIAIQSYLKDLNDYNAGVFDTNRDTAIRFRYDKESQKAQKDAVLTSLSNSDEVNIVDWSKKGFAYTGESIPKDEFKDDDKYTIIAAVDKKANSSQGEINSVYEVRDNDSGDVFSIKAPIGYNPTRQANIMEALQNAEVTRLNINEVKKEIKSLEDDWKKKSNTSEDKDKIFKAYRKALYKKNELTESFNTYQTNYLKFRGTLVTDNSTYTQKYE